MRTNLILIRNIFFICAISIIFIKVLDLGVGMLNPYYKYITKPSRYISIRELGAPGSYDIVLKEEDMKGFSPGKQADNTRKISINNDGFILGPEESLNSKMTVELVFLGGSTTETLHVSEGLRFPYLVGKNLTGLTNQKVNVLNGGVYGSNSMHNNLKLLAAVVKYKPKVVVLMNNMNDWRLLSLTKSYFDVPQHRGIIKTFPEVTITGFIKHGVKKAANTLMPNIFNNYIIKIKQKFFENRDEFSGFRKEKLHSVDEILPLYSRSLQTFIDICKRWDITPVIMTQMSLLDRETVPEMYLQKHKDKFDEYVIYQRVFNEEIRRIARLNDIDLVDLDKNISGKVQFVYDEVHLNDNGSVYAADLISQTLLKYF